MTQHDDLGLGMAFFRAHPDDLIELYSLQSGLAYEQLLLKGQLWSEPSFVFPADGASPAKHFAYRWMREQGIKRLESKWPHDALPLWCSLRPYQGYARKNDLMLTFKIPKKRLLPHLYDGWLQFLEIANFYAGQSWPAYWPTWARPYMDPFFIRSQEKGPVSTTPPAPPEYLCRQSWEVMFDLSIMDDARLAWAPTVHLATPFFDMNDLIRFNLVEHGKFDG